MIRRAIQTLRRGFTARARLVRSHPLRLLWFLLALVPLVGFGYLTQRIGGVINSRIQTFHELEPYEGDMTLQAIRLKEGKQLYPSRNSDYIPLLYTPLFSYMQWAIMNIVDPEGSPHTIYSGRLLSIFSAIGICLVIALWVFRETGSLMAALGGAGFFFACNPLVGWWYDLCRVDTAHVFFIAAGTWALLDRKSECKHTEIMKGILGGLFFSCGFFTKQTAGQVAIGMTILSLFISPRRAFWAGASGFTFGGFGLIYLTLTNTDFWYLAVTVPSNHVLDLNNWQDRLKAQVFNPMAIPLAVIVAWAILGVFRRQWRWPLLLAGLVWTGYFSMRGAITIGGYINHYIPFFFFVALLMGMAVGSFLPRGGFGRFHWKHLFFAADAAIIIGLILLVKGRAFLWPSLAGVAVLLIGASLSPNSSALKRPWRARIGLAPILLLTLICANHFHWTRVKKVWPTAPNTWAYDDPQYHIPKGFDGARAFMEAIRNLDGPVWIAHANYYAYLVGRPTDISADHVRDVAVAGQPTSPYVLEMLRQRRYKYILINNMNLDHDWQDNQVREAIRANYQVAENWEAKFGSDALRPVDSTYQKPRALLIRRGESIVPGARPQP